MIPEVRRHGSLRGVAGGAVRLRRQKKLSSSNWTTDRVLSTLEWGSVDGVADGLLAAGARRHAGLGCLGPGPGCGSRRRGDRLDLLARRALMSPRSFARRFKATTGTTPHAWLLGQRLAAAEALPASKAKTPAKPRKASKPKAAPEPAAAAPAADEKPALVKKPRKPAEPKSSALKPAASKEAVKPAASKPAASKPAKPAADPTAPKA